MNMKSQKLNRSIQAVLALGLLGGAGTAAANQTDECVAAAAVCAFLVPVDLVGCMAAAAIDIVVPGPAIACGFGSVGTAVECTSAARLCEFNPNARVPDMVSGGSVGKTTGSPNRTAVCGNGGGSITFNKINRVVQIGVEKGTVGGKAYATGLKITCMSGTEYIMGGTKDTYVGSLCAKGHAVAGVRFRSSAGGIQGIGRMCDNVVKQAGDKDDFYATPYPLATAGARVDRKCKEGTYLYGIRAWSSPSGHIIGAELLCRGYAV
jgi:hypothetical protein